MVRDKEGHPHQQPIHTVTFLQTSRVKKSAAFCSDNKIERSDRDCGMNQ